MARPWSARRFSLVDVVLACMLIAAAAAAAAVWLARTAPEYAPELHPEAQYFAATYGPQRSSYSHEEWIIRDFFQDRKGGFFVDVGANHYQITSNTYYLEKQLEWSGIAVEPLREFEADYVTHRPRTRFRAFFVSDASNERARMYVLDKNTLVSSADKRFTEKQGQNPTEVEVPTITLNDLLDSEKVQRIDFLSMDIELWEPKALAGFDIDRFRPQLVCIEGHPEVRQQILDYFAKHRYVLVGKYLHADVNNLYFTPLP